MHTQVLGVRIHIYIYIRICVCVCVYVWYACMMRACVHAFPRLEGVPPRDREQPDCWLGARF